MKQIKRFTYSSVTAAVLALNVFVPSSSSGEEPARAASILHHYTLPPLSLTNLGYTEAELISAQANGLPATDLPAPGSGIQWLGGNYYVGVSDRGPAIARTAPTGRIF